MPIGEQHKRWFAGLVPGEAALWRRWLKDHESEFDRFMYNVRVGEGAPGEPTVTDPTSELHKALVAMWKACTQLRIDAVGFNGAEVWIFEVKLAPAHGALGQLLAYQDRLASDWGLQVAPQLVIVCETLSRDLVSSYVAQGVHIYTL